MQINTWVKSGIAFSLGVVLGVSIIVSLDISAPKEQDEYYCFKGVLSVMPNQDTVVMGEQMVCAKDWTLSNMYGPVGILQDELDKGNDTKINFSTLEEIKRKYQEKQRDKMRGVGNLLKGLFENECVKKNKQLFRKQKSFKMILTNYKNISLS